jgi:hypothetical protein
VGSVYLIMCDLETSKTRRPTPRVGLYRRRRRRYAGKRIEILCVRNFVVRGFETPKYGRNCTYLFLRKLSPYMRGDECRDLGKQGLSLRTKAVKHIFIATFLFNSKCNSWRCLRSRRNFLSSEKNWVINLYLAVSICIIYLFVYFPILNMKAVDSS